MKIFPAPGRCLVQRDTAEERTPGGIVLPDKGKEKPTKGKIVALGFGKHITDGPHAGTPMEVQFSEGQRVYFKAYAGFEIDVKGEKFLLMEYDEILAVIE